MTEVPPPRYEGPQDYTILDLAGLASFRHDQQMSTRIPESLITEAQLRAGPPERVYDWLAARHAPLEEQPGAPVRDDELEAALLEIDHPLVALGLARYGLAPGVLGQLFNRTPKDEGEDPLRLAILSNWHALESNPGYPDYLLSEGETVTSWIAALTPMEIHLAFGHFGSETSVFAFRFVERHAADPDIPKAVRQAALRRLIDVQESLAAQGHGLTGLYTSIWSLAARLSPDPEWAELLRRPFERGRPFSGLSSPSIASLWYPPTDEASQAALDRNESGYFDDYQVIRRGLAAIALLADPSRGSAFLRSPDLGERAAAWQMHPMAPAEVTAAYECDGVLAARSMLDNPAIWMDPEAREALHDACQHLKVSDPCSSHAYLLSEFHWLWNEHERCNPEWFVEADG